MSENAGDVAALIPHGALAERMGIRIVEARPGLVRATMPVEGNTQPYGLLHGGASAVIAETVGSVAAALHGGLDTAPVGIELVCSHHKAVRGGVVTATATPLHEGRSLASYDIRVIDEGGALVCSARLTCMLRRPKADA